MGLCSRLLRRPRHRTGSLSMETTRYRANLRQVDTPLLELIMDGKFNKEIAAKLDLSIRTVEDRRARLMRRIGANSVVELVRMATPVG